MGTRAITHVMDNHGDIYVSLYRQFDGYPRGGHGEGLADFLYDAVIGNGIRMDEQRSNFFNGIGDLACRLIAFFKEDHKAIGGLYIVPPSRDNDQEFTYVVTCDSGYDREGGVMVEVINWDTSLFKGTANEFARWIADSEY